MPALPWSYQGNLWCQQLQEIHISIMIIIIIIIIFFFFFFLILIIFIIHHDGHDHQALSCIKHANVA